MKIALDFDQTITRDPELWSKFIELAKQRLHQITIVTFRSNGDGNDDIEAFAEEHGLNIVYTAGVQKASVFDADVWIDDMPEIIPRPDVLQGMLIGCRKNGE
jgi:predicted metal-dependent phosphotriesterase family hydrolase